MTCKIHGWTSWSSVQDWCNQCGQYKKYEFKLDELMEDCFCSKCGGILYPAQNWGNLGMVKMHICNPEKIQISDKYTLENAPYQGCLNREKEYVENTKNTAIKLREVLGRWCPEYNPHDFTKNYCALGKRLVRLCTCVHCGIYNSFIEIIGKMERYEYGKTN